LYETATGKEIRELPVAAGVVNFSWDGKSLATASGSSVKIWDLSNGNELQTLAGQLNARDVAFGSNSKILITGGDSIGLWDVASRKLIEILEGGTQTLALSSDGQWLATNPAGKLTVFSTRTWKVATISPSANAYVWSMGFAPPGLSHGDLSRSGVRWWQVGTGSEAQSIWGSSYATTFNPDGTLFATAAARGGEVTIWSTATGQQLQTLVAHDVGVNTVVFSPDGKWLLTGGQDSRLEPSNLAASFSAMKHSIKLWEVGTWKNRLVLSFTGMSGGFCGFSPDGQMLAISKADIGSTVLYSVPDGRELRKLASSAPGRLAFSPDGLWEAQGLNLWAAHGENK
jgi:WD40 repeat protein